MPREETNMATNQQTTALRKRQQIAGANRTMFFWVAGASVILGAALVISIFLVQKLLFNERVLAQKQKTASTLSENLDSINELKDKVRVLNTNAALKSTMTPDEQEPIQVVLDALPSAANPTAVGDSLQQKFLSDEGLKLESLTVDPVGGTEDGAATTETTGQNTIGFHFTVTSSDVNTIKTLLQKIERSIRTFDITTVKLDVQSNGDAAYSLSVDGVAFYQPAVNANLKETTISPDKGRK